jgi:hypothetical protein
MRGSAFTQLRSKPDERDMKEAREHLPDLEHPKNSAKELIELLVKLVTHVIAHARQARRL